MMQRVISRCRPHAVSLFPSCKGLRHGREFPFARIQAVPLAPTPPQLISTGIDNLDSSSNPPSATTTYIKPRMEERQSAAVATMALLGFSVFSDDLPLLRLLILTYSVWASGEWIVHRFFMHAKSGSLADRLVHINKLHVKHHMDTLKDMKMKEGYDPHALYFHFPNTALQMVTGFSILAALDLSLDLSIPYVWLVASSVCFALTHNLLWNTMHLDMHDAKQQLSDGIPCSDYQRLGKWSQYYVQWVFDNHTVHHEMGGSVNFNVVCPGPDLILGTYYQRSDNVKL